MTNEYVCNLGLWHDKKCINGRSSSNNGWIYTAYAKMLGFHVNPINLKNFYNLCKIEVNENRFDMNRLPNKHEPPMSRDEIIGMASLGVLQWEMLESNHWVFKGRGEKFEAKHVKKFLEGLAALALKSFFTRKKIHRNDFWKKNMKSMYQIAFRLAPHDVYYIKKLNGDKPNKIECTFWKLYVENTLKHGSESEQNILTLQLYDLRDRKLKKINRVMNYMNYFGREHPFYKVAIND